MCGLSDGVYTWSDVERKTALRRYTKVGTQEKKPLYVNNGLDTTTAGCGGPMDDVRKSVAAWMAGWNKGIVRSRIFESQINLITIDGVRAQTWLLLNIILFLRLIYILLFVKILSTNDLIPILTFVHKQRLSNHTCIILDSYIFNIYFMY